ncbi:MAG TPA: integrase arm-type DNA-binding domain-containing protein, partial [Steroidobacteraceae bacterium]|nr:integrase arm-type DNA-binding domain-containing protein [Steroidobacteraceae bacterium]
MPNLTDTDLRAAKPKDKPYKLRDEKGLHLLVTPSGGRLWRLRYRFGGRETMCSLGSYPEISLKRARERRDQNRVLIAEGIDPVAQRAAAKAAGSDTFEAVAREWLAIHRREVAEDTYEHTRRRLEQFVYPRLGQRPVAKIGAQDLLAVLRPLEQRGT